MTEELPAHLAAWANLPGPTKVIDAIRLRAERGHSTAQGVLSCRLDAAERRQVGRLLGNRWEVSGKPVRLQDLAAALGDITPLHLAQLTRGPITPRAEERAREREQARARRSAALDALVAAGVPPAKAAAWLAENPRSAALAQQVADVWRAIPPTPVHLPRLAADVCRDAHALDDDRPLGRATARLAAVVHDLERPQRSGLAWRAAWRAAGVLCNEVSSRVLILNLPLHGTAPAAALSTAVPGEPVWLTLRSLNGDWHPATIRPVRICENPTVVEAAAHRLAAHCPPLICTDGMPSLAATTLITGLAQAGCPIHARADHDQAGQSIMDRIRSAAPDMIPWRYDPISHPDLHEESLLPQLLKDLTDR